MTDKLTPPTLLTWDEVPDGAEFYEYLDDGSITGPYLRDGDIGWEGADHFILAPFPAPHKEIWVPFIIDCDPKFGGMLFDWNGKSFTTYGIGFGRKRSISLAAFILNELDLYDDEIRAKLEAAYHA